MSEQDIDGYGERLLQRSVDDLAKEFHGVWSRESIDRFVHECHDQLHEQGRGGRVNFAGLNAGRFARERLWALAQAEGHVEKTKPQGPVRLCAQRRSLADGRRAHAPPLQGVDRRAVGRVTTW